jgi:hypothetical protein
MKEKVAAVCMSCARELKIHPKDDPAEALKRNRWSNVNLPFALCRNCRKRGNHH